MKTIYKSLVILIALFNFSELQAQTNLTDFTLTSEQITVLDNTLSIASTIIKSGTTLTWTQQANGNSDTTTFSIQDTSGNWDTTTGLGAVTYNMTLESYECTLTLTGDAQGMSATLSFVEFNAEQGDYVFTINTISYQ